MDRQTQIDIMRWRRSERQRLIVARLAVPVIERVGMAKQMATSLDRLIDPYEHPVLALYWPFRGEPDFRDWMATMHERGAVIALPVVIEKARPLIFREWQPHCPMKRGVWNIPIPSEGREIAPDVVISPVVGTDPECYRLGYGGGFYDRTLANLPNDPLVLGVGYPISQIDTIFPLPHDVPMDRVILGHTENVRTKTG